MLRNDARTLLYIRRHTYVPCPEVLGFDDSLTNTLGAPYIIMREMEGIPSNKIWFDRDTDGGKWRTKIMRHAADFIADDDVTNADLPDAGRMHIRVNILRSLATCMSKLQTLEFECAGTLDFDDNADVPKVGPTYHWKPMEEMEKLSAQDLSTSKSIECIPIHPTSGCYFMIALNERWPRREDAFAAISNGRRCILRTMLSNTPFSHSTRLGDAKETFLRRHDDLDFQNILCDEEGNVVGIIHWDKCRATPRCLGFAALPAFLTKDWAPGFSSLHDIHMPWELAEYRSVYARAMLEATGPDGDGKNTINSAIYEAVNAALYGGHNGGSVGNLVHRLIKALATTRMFDDKDVLSRLGQDWEMGEFKIGAELKEFIAPQSHVEAIEPWFFPGSDQES